MLMTIAIFINPIREEVNLTLQMLKSFGDASILVTNFSKSAFYPMACGGLQLDSNLAWMLSVHNVAIPMQILGSAIAP